MSIPVNITSFSIYLSRYTKNSKLLLDCFFFKDNGEVVFLSLDRFCTIKEAFAYVCDRFDLNPNEYKFVITSVSLYKTKFLYILEKINKEVK